MEVFVDVAGTSHWLEIQPHDTVEDLKSRLELMNCVNASSVDLYLEGTLLEGHLHRSGVTMGCSIKAEPSYRARCRAELVELGGDITKGALTSAIENGNTRVAKLLLEILPGPLDIVELVLQHRRVQVDVGVAFLAKYPTVKPDIWEFMNYQPVEFFALIFGRCPPTDDYLMNNIKRISEANACLLIRKGYSPCQERGSAAVVVFLAQQRLTSFMRTYLLAVNSSAVHDKDQSGRTALHYAVGCGNLDMVRTLLEQGADPNARDNHDDTPLHEACYVDFYEVTELLLLKGAQMDVTNRSGYTPMDLALKAKHTAPATKRLLQAHLPLTREAQSSA